MPADAHATCFIDTNIWLYAFIEADNPTKSAIARQLIQQTEPVISVQVINEVSINLLKKANFSEEQLRQLIKSFYGKYRVIDYSQDLLMHDSNLRQRYSFSYWDSTIVAAALQASVSLLYSEDMHHTLLIENQVQIVNPFLGA